MPGMLCVQQRPLMLLPPCSPPRRLAQQQPPPSLPRVQTSRDSLVSLDAVQRCLQGIEALRQPQADPDTPHATQAG